MKTSRLIYKENNETNRLNICFIRQWRRLDSVIYSVVKSPSVAERYVTSCSWQFTCQLHRNNGGKHGAGDLEATPTPLPSFIIYLKVS